MKMAKRKKKDDALEERYVIQIRKVLDNKKYADSVTKFVDGKLAKEVYELLEG